jgi:hypothetical protein
LKAGGVNFERVYDSFTVRHVQYDCPTVESFVDLYNHIQDMKPRSQDHITRMVATLCKDWYDGNKGQEAAKCVITGLRYWMDPGMDVGKNSKRMLPEYAVAIVKKDPFLQDAVRIAVETVGRARSQPTKVLSMVQNQVVVAAMMECYTSRHESKAVDFFDRYLDMDFANAPEIKVTYNWVSKYLTTDPRSRSTRTRLDWFNGFVSGFRGFCGKGHLTKIQRPKKPGRLRVSLCDWNEYWKSGRYR